MSYEQMKYEKYLKHHEQIATMLTTFYDKAEEALQSGEGMEEALEFIGIKSDEMLQKI